MKNNHKKLVTHNGSFHTDDVFACATLSLLLEKKDEKFEIIRTRDSEIIKTGDYVFDIGGIYDEEKNRFDHHQIGGAGKHWSNIEYSSFGLVWKKFGLELTGSEKITELVDKHLVAPIDASDNGFDLVGNKYDIFPYFIQDFFISMRPTWREDNLDVNDIFLKSVEIAKEVLSRKIIHTRDFIFAEEKMTEDYQNAKNKKIVILEKDYFYENILNKFPEPLFVVYPRNNENTWGVRAIREDSKSFKNRKNFPTSWAGLRDKELQKITEVKDAVFCHRALFLVVVKSKKGAIKLAELALLG